jgi:hypothetical protein
MLYGCDRICGLVVRIPGYRSRGAGFDSRRYQIFSVVVLEWDPLSLVSITEELLEWESSDILYPQKWALASPTSGAWM